MAAPATSLPQDHIAGWLSWLQIERNLAPSTVQAYQREITALCELGLPQTMTTDDLQKYLAKAGGKPSTIAGRIAALSSYYKFLGIIDARLDDPTAKGRLFRPKLPKLLPKPIPDVDRKIDQLPGPYRDIAIFILGAGVRISEACRVGWSRENPSEPDVTLPTPKAMTIFGKGSKDRRIPIPLEAREALDRLGGQIAVPGRQKRNIQRIFKKHDIKAHGLRHSMGCELGEAGADIRDIQQLLGHANANTTQGYVEYAMERLEEVQERRRKRRQGD
jgi:site-specific recombinase XerD